MAYKDACQELTEMQTKCNTIYNTIQYMNGLLFVGTRGQSKRL